MRPRKLVTAFAALALLGCSGMTGPRPARTETLVSASAVVQSVDPATRQVVLREDDGATIGIVAGPEVRNLPQLAAGDRVNFDYYESIMLSLADPAAGPGTLVAAARAPQGASPGAAAVVASDLVVTLLSYDASSGLATFRTADGVVRRATVPPELRGFAAARAIGSQVNVSVTQAVAISISEA